MVLLGSACNQTPECGDAAANDLALSLISDALPKKFSLDFEVVSQSQAFCTCCSVRAGTSADDRDFQMAIELVCDKSSNA